jgi:hypothetical protein
MERRRTPATAAYEPEVFLEPYVAVVSELPLRLCAQEDRDISPLHLLGHHTKLIATRFSPPGEGLWEHLDRAFPVVDEHSTDDELYRGDREGAERIAKFDVETYTDGGAEPSPEKELPVAMYIKPEVIVISSSPNAGDDKRLKAYNAALPYGVPVVFMDKTGDRNNRPAIVPANMYVATSFAGDDLAETVKKAFLNRNSTT